MPSGSARISARRLRDRGNVERMPLLRGNDLLLAEVGAAEAADRWLLQG